MKVQGRVVVLTGAASGIGRELALQLAGKGAIVAAVDINAAALEQTKQLAGASADRITGFVANVTDRAEVHLLAAKVAAELGNVDCVINNAGVIQPFVRLADLPDETLDRVLQVNLMGVLNVTRAFLPGLLQRPAAHIVNVSSMGGFVPVPGQTAYGAAKAAVKLLTEGLASELLHTHVKVSVVCPGAVATNIMQNSGVTLGAMSAGGQRAPKILSATRAAQIVLHGIEKDKLYIFVGRDALLMHSLYRLSPGLALKAMSRAMSKLLH